MLMWLDVKVEVDVDVGRWMSYRCWCGKTQMWVDTEVDVDTDVVREWGFD